MGQPIVYKKDEQTAIDFDFSGKFVEDDDINPAGITVIISPAGLAEISGRRAIAGQLLQLRFDASAAALRTTYKVVVVATSLLGDIYPLISDPIVVVPNDEPIPS